MKRARTTKRDQVRAGLELVEHGPPSLDLKCDAAAIPSATHEPKLIGRIRHDRVEQRPGARAENLDAIALDNADRHAIGLARMPNPTLAARVMASTPRFPLAINAVPLLGDFPSLPSGRMNRSLRVNRTASADRHAA